MVLIPLAFVLRRVDREKQEREAHMADAVDTAALIGALPDESCAEIQPQPYVAGFTSRRTEPRSVGLAEGVAVAAGAYVHQIHFCGEVRLVCMHIP